MSDEFTHRILRMVIGRVCQPLGVHGMQQSVCDCMADVLKQYILTLGRTTASYCAHANRTEPNFSDVFQAFRDLGINLSDLSEFTREVESVAPPEPIPHYPVPRSSTHIYHAPSGGKPATGRRARTGSLSSEDESDRDHIPPYLPPLPLEAEEEKEEGDDQGMDDQQETSESSTPMDTSHPPPDPTKGLPQLFRSRRLSSDFSEDGESASSRRNSISNGAAMMAARTPGNGASTTTSIAESGLIGMSDNNRGTMAIKGKEGVVVGEASALVTEEPKMLSGSVVVQKVNVFDMAFSQKLLEKTQGRQKPVEQAQPAQPTGQAEITATTSSGGEALPMLTKPVKLDLPTAQLAQPVLFQKPAQPPTQTRVLPPPLKLMSPTSSEHPNMPTQQPPLSPLTTRSPVQIVGMPRMPVLSPLRTPTLANRHPMRMPGAYTHPTTSSPLLSPPALRSPVDTIPTPIDAHLHGGAMPIQVPPMHGPPSQISYSAHPPPVPQLPPSVPFTAQPLQVQATPTPAPSNQATVMPTSAVSSEDTAMTREAVSVEIKETSTTQPTVKVHVEHKMSVSDINLRDVRVSIESAPTTRKRPRSRESSESSASSSPPPPPPATDKTDTEPIPEAEKDSTIQEQPSPRPTDREIEEEERKIETLQVLRGERLSVSPVSTDENILTPESSPLPKIAPAMIEETSLKDLEISDDGLSDDEEEEEGGNEEAPLITIKPSSPQQQEEIEQESLQEGERLSAPPSTGGKKMIKELSFSPISSPESEFEAETQIKPEKQEELSPQDVAQVSKQPETVSLDVKAEEMEPVTSPETFLDVSSDEEGTEETTNQPIAESQAMGGAELIEEQDVAIEQKRGDTKVEVLDSASVPYSDDNVQDMGTVEEVLEVLEQKFSSDEESDESEEEGEEPKEEGVEPPEGVGVASEIGGDVVSGEGVMVGGEEEDMVETLSAMVHTPQQQPTLTTVTTESVSLPSKVSSRDIVFGIKKSAPTPPRPKSLKISLRRRLIGSLRPPAPEPKKQQAMPITTPIPSSTPSRFLTKAEKKADVASHIYHQQHHGHGGSVVSGAVGGGVGGGGGLIVTQGETKNLAVPLSTAPAPHTPSASPSPSPAPPDEEEDQLDQPMTIIINRRLLRHSRFGIATPVEERSRLPTATTLKMRLARFGAAGQAPPTGSVTTVTSHVTSVPSVNLRKRERDSDNQGGTTVMVGREVKRSRHESPPVQVPSHQRHVSSSSSSSSTSSDDDSGSDESADRSSPYPSYQQPIPPASASTPLPPPTLPSSHHHQPHTSHYHQQLHHRHRTRTPSSVEEEDDDDDEEEESVRAATPASSESGSTLGSGGGLKLTISKAVLKQAKSSAAAPPSTSSPLSTTLFVGPAPAVEQVESSGRGGRRGSRGGSRRGRGGKRGRRSSTTASKPAAAIAPPPTLSVKSSQPKKVKKKDLAGGATKPSSVKQAVPKIQIQSSSPIIIKLPTTSTTKSRSSKSTASSVHSKAGRHRPAITVASLSVPSTGGAATAMGSDYHCPECGLRDDGSPMIGCDGCDSWVHWTCVGITREPPADEKWFCPSCVEARQSGKKKKGRKRKRTSN